MAFMNYYGKTVSAEASSGEVTFDDLNGVLSIWERPQYDGYIRSTGEWMYVGKGTYKYAFIKVSPGDVFWAGGDAYRIAVVTDLSTPTEGASANPIDNGSNGIVSSSAEYTVPEGANYIGICTLNNGTVPTINHLYINDIDYARSVREELWSSQNDNGVNWVAFGDSITHKYYSYFNEDGTVTTKENGWSVVYLNAVAKKNHWNVTNKGYGGMGWIMTSTGADTYIAYNRIKEIDFTQYNLVTFAYGINDWKGNKPLGSLADEFVYDEAMTPATVIESMRYCFEYIMSKNPQIKIIVITPLNCRGYSYDFGDDSTCWARGYTGFTNTGTLDEFADTMMAVCDSYGIECIDMTRNSCINKANIVQMLPDGVHPSAECHEMIGIELAKKINFC